MELIWDENRYGEIWLIKRDSNDLLSGSHEVKFFAKSEIDAIKPFNDADMRGLIVLKEGTDSWGLRHIFKKHIDQFVDVFGISEDEAELARFLRQVIEEGRVIEWGPDPKGGWDIVYVYGGKKVYIVVSEGDKGIITAYPYGG